MINCNHQYTRDIIIFFLSFVVGSRRLSEYYYQL